MRQGLSGFLEQDCFGSIAYLSYDAVGRGLGVVNRGGFVVAVGSYDAAKRGWEWR